MKQILSFAIAIPFVLLVACKDDPPAGGIGVPPAEDAGTDSGSTVTSCSAQRDVVLQPIDRVSTAAVSEATGGLLYVDGSGGGANQASRNPRVYVNLGGKNRVAVTDKSATSSTDWDIAFKRTVIFTNGGDSGPGAGGAAVVNKDFDAVTAADADGAAIVKESFFDEECNEKKDQFDLYLNTTFSDWYDYDTSSMGVSPKPGRTYIVVGGNGTRYKVAITTWTGRPDGTTNNPSTGHFLLKVAPL
jgi:hypothetical protein